VEDERDLRGAFHDTSTTLLRPTRCLQVEEEACTPVPFGLVKGEQQHRNYVQRAEAFHRERGALTEHEKLRRAPAEHARAHSHIVARAADRKARATAREEEGGQGQYRHTG